MQNANHALSGVPKGQGLLYNTDGTKTIVDGPFDDSDAICKILNCIYLQMVPATVGALASKAILLMDEEGRINNKPQTCVQRRNSGSRFLGPFWWGTSCCSTLKIWSK